MSAVCYFLIYTFESLISWMYFSEKFAVKTDRKITILTFTASAGIQYALSFIGIPFVNMGAFLVCNFLLSQLLFDTSIIQSLFNTILLSAIMLTTELLVFYVSILFFDIAILQHKTNDLTLFVQSACSKLLYFLVAYLIAKLSTKESRKELGYTKASMLFILPLASITLLHGIVIITTVVETPLIVYAISMITTLLLIYSNIIVFWVHESMLKAQQENTEFRLQKLKAELDTEYYTILQNQYENSNILIHDIKRHLLSVKELANHNDCDSINRYIDDLYDEYQIKYLKKYSNNRLINAIVNRYMSICEKFGIDFYCDVRDIDFSFISDANLTSILDNLLENAVEAAKDSETKTIEFTIKKTNSNFVVFHLENSCSQAPKKSNGELKTTKLNKDIHGFGLKSIKRIAKEHSGSTDYHFDDETMTITFNVILKQNTK